MSQQDCRSTNIKESKLLKQITRDQLLDNLKSFSQEFKEFDPKITISTPQADRGIGPVQYDIKFRANRQVLTGHLRILSKMIELEKIKGDELIKLDASLLFLATGREDPLGFLPAGCRAAIRTEIQEATSKLNDKLKLAFTNNTNRETLNDLITSAENLPRPANPAEIALICDGTKRTVKIGRRKYVLPRHPDFSYGGIKRTMAKHRREQTHIRRIRRVIRRQFKKGAVEAMDVKKKVDVDEEAGEEENRETPLAVQI